MSAREKRSFVQDLKTIPNLLCIYRIVAVVIAVSIFYMGHPIISVSLGITAGLTDYADGYFARKYNLVTELGALLDALADLLFAFICLVVAVDFNVWPLYLLLLWGFRDLTVLALRASAAQQGFAIPSIFLGKLASNFLFYSFILMAFDYARPFDNVWITDGIHYLGLFGIHAGIAMQWITAVVYFRRYTQLYTGRNPLEAEAE